jgi:hypothetical protein
MDRWIDEIGYGWVSLIKGNAIRVFEVPYSKKLFFQEMRLDPFYLMFYVFYLFILKRKMVR